MALGVLVLLWVLLLGLWCDADSRLQRVERVVYSIAGSYPDGQFKREPGSLALDTKGVTISATQAAQWSVPTVTDAVPW